jgi:alkyldihydroxyacetonephosphate synthase
LVADNGGSWDKDSVDRSMSTEKPVKEGEGEHRKGAAGDWRNQFLRAPYYRNYLTPAGLIVDTFETSITWDRFDEFYAGVRERVGKVIKEVSGAEPMLSCRFTHVYPDGPAPYFTYYCVGSNNGDMASMLDRWRTIKLAANEAVISLGGTVTHHHAVGRDHRPQGYDLQAPPLFRKAFAGARQVLDPSGMMNPGVLIDTPARGATTGGALRTKN